MKGYVAKKGDRWYAVFYEGLDPVTGKELRKWHPAGTSREDAERLAARLAKELNGRNDDGRSLTFGAYLTTRWLPGKKLELARSTWDGYRRNIDRHILPTLGKVSIRRLRPHHLEALYDQKLHPTNGRKPLAPKTVLEIHLIIRGALNDAVRRGIATRNVAYVAHAPKLRAIPKVEQQAWAAQELQGFLRAAAGHRLFPAMWLSANTGLRRSELPTRRSGEAAESTAGRAIRSEGSWSGSPASLVSAPVRSWRCGPRQSTCSMDVFTSSPPQRRRTASCSSAPRRRTNVGRCRSPRHWSTS